MAVDRISLLALFLVLCCAGVTAQNCESQMRCSQCIGTAGCVWCADAIVTGARCQTGPTISGCSSLQNPNGSIGNIATSNTQINPVSIQNISLTLRVGEPQTFTVQVTPLRNLPLDLYILMDLSNSMGDELESVQAIAGDIAMTIQDVTQNVRLGFGSFSDKVTRPFTRDTCEAGTPCSLYAFRHQIDLISDAIAFNSAIQSVGTTTNVDNPENGLEALAQVVTCEDIIGWRSRGATGDDRGLTRIVLFLTDDQFHYSGEGRLAGILRPYDGRCYLERDASTPLPIEYSRWNEFDYPSVGQIVSLLTQFEVVAIFAVEEDVLATYQNLRDLVNLKYRASAAILTNNSVDILDLIDTEYRAILQAVSLLPPVTNDLDFSIQATCPPGAILSSDGSCVNVQLESPVNFTITVTLTSCEQVSNGDTKVARFNVPSFGEFDITYTGACNCDCERNPVINSPMCSGNGNFVCSVCECHPGFCGPTCAIVIGNRAAQDCPLNCSGRGVCDCTCMCNAPDSATEPELSTILATNPDYDARVFSGDERACECDNFRCGLGANGMSCSGNGVCCNRQCRCNVFRDTNETYHAPGTPTVPGSCECPPESRVCCRQSPNMVCNGNGRCNCSSCSCNPGFVGQCCDRLSSSLCSLTVDVRCVLCEKSVQTMDCDGCGIEIGRQIVLIEPALVTNDNVTQIVEIVNMRINDGTRYSISSTGECTARDANGCTHGYFLLSNDQFLLSNDEFLLSNDQNTVVAVVNDPPVCPPPPEPLLIPIWAVALIILAGLLILGIVILVIIKIIFLILDYLEVKRWEKEAREADFSKNQNPLYQSPEMKYENVAYGRE